MRRDNIQAFGQDYAAVCDQLNENITGSVAHQILQLETLIKKWSNAIDDITYNIDQYEGALEFLAEFEAGNYKDRLDMLTSFVTDSITQLDLLKAAQNSLLDSSGIIDTSMGGSNYNPNSNYNPSMAIGGKGYDENTDYAQKILDSDSWAEVEVWAMRREFKIADGYGTENVDGVVIPVVPTEEFVQQWIEEQKKKGNNGYAKGGVVDFTGTTSVHGSNNNPEVVFNANDAVKLYDMVHTTADLGKELKEGAAEIKLATGSIYKLVEKSELFKGDLPFDLSNNILLFDTYEKMMKNSLQSISNITNNQINKTQPITVEFNGDFNLPNVHNPADFANFISTTINNKIIQDLSWD